MAFKSLGPVDDQQWTFVASSTKEVNNTGGLWSGLNEISHQTCVTDLGHSRESRNGGGHQFTPIKYLFWRRTPPSSGIGGEQLDGITSAILKESFEVLGEDIIDGGFRKRNVERILYWKTSKSFSCSESLKYHLFLSLCY